eukprot:541554-Pelagomonas_calceolata.AAC.5
MQVMQKQCMRASGVKVRVWGPAEPEERDCEGQHERQLAARLPDPSAPEGPEDGRVRVAEVFCTLGSLSICPYWLGRKQFRH